VAPIMGFVLANVMFFSGVPGMLRCKRQGSLGDMNPLPFPVVLAGVALCITFLFVVVCCR
jgi:solute carrier family 50 protein (sugar transporter)